jgi:hypothetical protein
LQSLIDAAPELESKKKEENKNEIFFNNYFIFKKKRRREEYVKDVKRELSWFEVWYIFLFLFFFFFSVLYRYGNILQI